MMMGGRQAHVLAIANPAQGHVGPLMKLSLLIADQGIKVTFLNAASIHARVLATVSSENGKIHDLILYQSQMELIRRMAEKRGYNSVNLCKGSCRVTWRI